MDFFSFDDEYLRRLAAGDPVTEEHFYRYFRELLTLKLRGRLRSTQAVEDVTQDVFLRVVGAVRSGAIREGAKLGPYVNGVCNNALLEWYRKEGRAEQLDENYDVPDPSVLPDLVLLTEEQRAIVRTILKEMPPKDAAILRARFLEERSPEDISREFGVERGYLRVLLHRAKKRFRALLGKPWDPPPRRK